MIKALDILGTRTETVDILALDILVLDILDLDILGPTPPHDDEPSHKLIVHILTIMVQYQCDAYKLTAQWLLDQERIRTGGLSKSMRVTL